MNVEYITFAKTYRTGICEIDQDVLSGWDINKLFHVEVMINDTSGKTVMKAIVNMCLSLKK